MPPELTLGVGEYGQIRAMVYPPGANQGVNFVSEAQWVASVDGMGQVFGESEGETDVVITTEDGGKTDRCRVTVLPAGSVPVTDVTLSPSALNLAPGGTGTLTATVLPSNASNKNVTWKSSNMGVATVADMGGGQARVTAVASGTASITVTTQHGGHSRTCAITVSGSTSQVPVTGVSITQSALNLTPGGTGMLTAAVLPSNATNQGILWSSSNPVVATVSVSGGQSATVTAGTAGTAVITVTTEDGGYSSTCTVTVSGSSAAPGVYVGGDFGLVKDGVLQPAYNGCRINSLAFDGNDLHACGTDASSKPAHWKNGAKTLLPMTSGSTQGEALGMLVTTDHKVYVAGYEFIAGGSGNRRGKLWLDGIDQGVGAVAGTTSYSFHCAAIRHGANGDELHLGGHHKNPGFEGFCLYRMTNDGWRVWSADTFYNEGDYGYPQDILALAGDNAGYIWITSGFDAYSPNYALKFNIDLVDSDPANVLVQIGDAVLYSIRNINGIMYAAGYRVSTGFPPCYMVGAAVTTLPWSSAGGVQYAEGRDIARGPDGTIYTCGIDLYDNGDGPKLWKGTVLQSVPAWNGTQSGGAWAIAVK
jgi:uncharacterized protein YjdB